MLDFLEKNSFFSKNQFGFRKGLSTEHSLFEVDNFVRKNIDDNLKVMAIFLDVHKAFDSVNQEILLRKLFKIGTYTWNPK